MRWRGLYAITPDQTDTPRLERAVALALEGGAVMLQYRNKSTDKSLRLSQASALLRLCRDAQVPLIINDDIDLAARIGADGVHLGRDDNTIAAARTRLGPAAIIGVSCYADLQRALTAQSAGADYVAFGSFFASETKAAAVRATISLLHSARPRLQVPVAAIGGITPTNAAPLVAAGADLLAVITALFDAPDIRAVARQFSNLHTATHV